MPECDRCGDALVGPRDKNLSGHWRDICADCHQRQGPPAHQPPRDPATWLAEEPTPEGFHE